MDTPLTGAVLAVVDIGFELAKEEWERHDWDVVVACEAAVLLARSWIRLLGLHFGVTFDSHLVDEALHDAGCEEVDTVLDIPSLMQVVEGRRGPPTKEYEAMDVADAFT